ncbi:hypothetical protein ACOMHN_042327 [Nucella lapillus]
MADTSKQEVENLDEFDEAEELTTTFCQQITEEQYENQISEETEKALNELKDYLQKNPDTYFRIIRKRKQEELESAGVFSFLKVKMMSLLHGEQYPACLVSPEQSTQKLNQLTVDMQKAFTYSEESKGRRFSKRLAAARSSRLALADISDNKENTPVLQPHQPPLRGKRLVPSRAQDDASPVRGSGGGEGARLRSAKKNAASPRGLSAPPPIMAVLPSKTAHAPSPISAPPPLPPPPPPPPLLPQHTDSSPHPGRGGRARRRSTRDVTGAESRYPLLVRSPLASVRSEPTSGCTPTPPGCADRSGGRKACVSGDAGDTTPPASAPSSPSDCEFVTPESDIPVAKKHKRTLSNLSTGSTGSQQSLSSIHSELMSSNPLNRLRSTQLARSPGGTPLRTLNRSRLPTEPLHKALVSVLRHKFRNVRTPSPLTGGCGGSGTSLTSPDPARSRNTSLNATFSP